MIRRPPLFLWTARQKMRTPQDNPENGEEILHSNAGGSLTLAGSKSLMLAGRALLYFLPFSALAGLWLWTHSSLSAEPVFLIFYATLGLCAGLCFALAKAHTRCKAAKAALREERERQRQLLDASPNGILETDTQGRILFANRACHKGVGYEEGSLIGGHIRDLLPERVRGSVMASLSLAASGRAIPNPYQTQNVTREGRVIDVEIAWNSKRDKRGQITGFVSIITDITARRKAEENLKDSETRYRAIFEQSSDSIALIRMEDGQVVTFNENAHRHLGYSREEFSRLNLADFDALVLKGDSHRRISEMLEKRTLQTRHRTKEGGFREIEAASSAMSIQGERYLLLIWQDVTAGRRAEEELYKRAHYDPLTGLANRRLFSERLQQALKLSRRKRRQTVLLFIDLDRFKHVNDTLGHHVGDQVLKFASKRLVKCVRETDTVARSGGDEFLIVLPETNGRADATIVAEKIVDHLSRPFQVEGRTLYLGASCGITISPDDGEEASTLMKNADMAMYKAKGAGRNFFCFFNREIKKVAEERSLMEWDLRRALAKQEMLVYYQPIVDLKSLKTISLEALVRWKHPHKGLIPPHKFIPLAEESNLIAQIDAWVIETACRQVCEWRKRYNLNLSLSANLSGREFSTGNLLSMVSTALEKSHLPPGALTVEVTEGVMLDPDKEAASKLHALKGIGIKIAIDDFGTGYSSLSYLSKYPVDLLKIDQSFIRGIGSDPKKSPLVKAIVRMGQSLKLKVVAEGVSDHPTLSFLMQLHCDAAQGFYFSQPLAAEDYEAVLHARHSESL